MHEDGGAVRMRAAGDGEERPKFRRRAQVRPGELLDAALALFGERGFASTRVEDIAERAGVSKGTVYLYFPSKLAVLEALVVREVSPARLSGLEGAPDPTQPALPLIEQALRRIAGALSHQRALSLPRIVLREALVLPEIARMYRERVLGEAIPLLAGIVTLGIARGEFAAVDPELAVRTLVGGLVAHVLLAEVFGEVPAGGLDLQRFVENHLRIVLGGLARANSQGAGP